MRMISARLLSLGAVSCLLSGCNLEATPTVKQDIAQVDQHNFPEILELDEAIRRNPKDSDLYYKRGYAWHGRGDFRRVYRDYDEAIRLNPNNPSYYDSRGFAYHMDNRQEGKV